MDLVAQALPQKQGAPGSFHRRRQKLVNSSLIRHVWYRSIAGCPHGFVSCVDWLGDQRQELYFEQRVGCSEAVLWELLDNHTSSWYHPAWRWHLSMRGCRWNINGIHRFHYIHIWQWQLLACWLGNFPASFLHSCEHFTGEVSNLSSDIWRNAPHRYHPTTNLRSFRYLILILLHRKNGANSKTYWSFTWCKGWIAFCQHSLLWDTFFCFCFCCCCFLGSAI